MRKMAAVVVCAALAAGGASAAEETNQLPDMVVVVSRSQATAGEMPANVTVVTARDLAEAGYENVVDVLDDQAGIVFRTTSGNASQAQISMRGFGENSHGRVLVLLDGKKLNRPDMERFSWLQIPLSNVERIEILRGANVALYGDHAVAGVINIVTKKGAEETAGSASVSVGSFGSDTERAGVSGRRGKLSYSVNAEHTGTKGWRDRSGYSSWGAGASLGRDFGDSLSASLALSFDDMDYEIPSGLTREEMEANPQQSVNPDDAAANRCFNADFNVAAKLGGGCSADAGVSFGRKNVQSDMASWFSFVDMEMDTIGLTPRCIWETQCFGRDNRLLAGADLYIDTLDVRRYADAARGAETSTASIRKRTLGVYANDRFCVTPSLALGVGGRVERAQVDAQMESGGAPIFDDGKTHDATAADVSLTYSLGDRSKLFARAGTLYRYPFLDEQVSYFGFGSDGLYASVEAETGENYELGADVELGKRVTVSLTAFLLNMKDEIAYNAVTMQNENLDRTRRMGAEAGFECRLVDSLRVKGSWTLTDARFAEGDNDGNRVPLVPESSATLGGRLDLPYGLALEADARYVGSSFLGGDNANAAEMLPDYTVVDLAVRFVPKAVDGLEVFAAVDNILDEQYATEGYVGWSGVAYYPSPGRGFRGGVSYSF